MGQTAQKNDKNQPTEIPVGEILRRTRIHYKQSISDIERALRIRADQIEAIECGDVEKLPGRVYAIGFVRTYSEYLGLDGDKMISLFKTQCVDKVDQPAALNFPEKASDNRMPSRWLIIGTMILVVVVIALWSSSTSGSRKIVESIPEAPKTTPRLASSPPPDDLRFSATQKEAFGPPAPPPQSAEQTIAEKPGKGIILNINQNSWVEIRDQAGNALLSRVLQAGDQYFVPDRPDLFISIGNAGGVTIEVDGAALRSLGKSGDVLRNLRLDTEFLKQNFAQGAPQGAPLVAPAQKQVENPL